MSHSPSRIARDWTYAMQSVAAKLVKISDNQLFLKKIVDTKRCRTFKPGIAA